ncbi:polyprenyl synthetase family protein [Risungbinella massiliensis]|uniref:polyprenyl synthetase family protein n=1 Tax=Risungbinella massiliensis TaxID=1329796 RepID=UPI0005CBEE3D|nr:polyprenyl synthetase family protein [Risungbinella massiliensis]
MLKLQNIYVSLRNDLEQVEKRLAESIQTTEPSLAKSSRHLLDAGGKRMRPVFVLLSGRMGNYQFSQLLPIAVSLELIHMASLVHDDVIDNAQTRRGRTTVKAEWDNKVAMYTGDYLFAKALQEMKRFQSPEGHRILSRAINEVCLGEIDQLRDLFQPNQSLRNYLHRIKRKTALLMAISCRLGAIGSGADEQVVRLLTRYGYCVGMAFQMTDDVLDLVGEEKILGKPAGSDLRQGNVTLPVIYALQHLPQEQKASLLTYLTTRGEEGDLSELLTYVKKSGGIEYTLELSRKYLSKALASLEAMPKSSERESLRLIAEFIVSRSY